MRAQTRQSRARTYIQSSLSSPLPSFAADDAFEVVVGYLPLDRFVLSTPINPNR